MSLESHLVKEIFNIRLSLHLILLGEKCFHAAIFVMYDYQAEGSQKAESSIRWKSYYKKSVENINQEEARERQPAISSEETSRFRKSLSLRNR